MTSRQGPRGQTKEQEEDKWKEVRGKTAARSVQRPLLVSGVNNMNEFNMLDEQGRGKCSYSGLVTTDTLESLPT